MASINFSLPQQLLDEQEALLARIARCREKLSLAVQRARAALSLEDTAEAFFGEQVPWAKRGGAPIRAVIARPAATRLTSASRTPGELVPLPAPRPSPAIPAAAGAPAAVATAPADEMTATAFFESVPWDSSGSGKALGRSPWSNAGASDFLRAATESAVRASQS
ncbi:MAG: hypothetical protein CFK52_08175, partial [Chloracidobacterium sp. CP2_5A]